MQQANVNVFWQMRWNGLEREFVFMRYCVHVASRAERARGLYYSDIFSNTLKKHYTSYLLSV